jgi:hypothetical protein
MYRYVCYRSNINRPNIKSPGYIALVEEDFEWITNNLIRIANSCCEGRVVSALEGGYQIGKSFDGDDDDDDGDNNDDNDNSDDDDGDDDDNNGDDDDNNSM